MKTWNYHLVESRRLIFLKSIATHDPLSPRKFLAGPDILAAPQNAYIYDASQCAGQRIIKVQIQPPFEVKGPAAKSCSCISISTSPQKLLVARPFRSNAILIQWVLALSKECNRTIYLCFRSSEVACLHVVHF